MEGPSVKSSNTGKNSTRTKYELISRFYCFSTSHDRVSSISHQSSSDHCLTVILANQLYEILTAHDSRAVACLQSLKCSRIVGKWKFFELMLLSETAHSSLIFKGVRSLR